MVYIKLFLKLLPYIIDLVKAAETWLGAEPGQGTAKKEAVITALRTILAGWGEAVTGGAKDAWEKMEPIISKTIDFAVGIIFNFNR